MGLVVFNVYKIYMLMILKIIYVLKNQTGEQANFTESFG